MTNIRRGPGQKLEDIAAPGRTAPFNVEEYDGATVRLVVTGFTVAFDITIDTRPDTVVPFDAWASKFLEGSGSFSLSIPAKGSYDLDVTLQTAKELAVNFLTLPGGTVAHLMLVPFSLVQY